MASYGTVAGYKAYADDRGWSYVDYTDADITAALVRASDYIDGAYRGAFCGYRTDGRSQDREWPRVGVVDREGYNVPSDTVPAEVENATYEGAKRELASAGALSPDIEAGGRVIKREKTGPLETEYYVNGSLTATFQAIDQALGPLLSVSSAYSSATARA